MGWIDDTNFLKMFPRHDRIQTPVHRHAYKNHTSRFWSDLLRIVGWFVFKFGSISWISPDINIGEGATVKIQLLKLQYEVAILILQVLYRSDDPSEKLLFSEQGQPGLFKIQPNSVPGIRNQIAHLCTITCSYEFATEYVSLSSKYRK